MLVFNLLLARTALSKIFRPRAKIAGNFRGNFFACGYLSFAITKLPIIPVTFSAVCRLATRAVARLARLARLVRPCLWDSYRVTWAVIIKHWRQSGRNHAECIVFTVASRTSTSIELRVFCDKVLTFRRKSFRAHSLGMVSKILKGLLPEMHWT